VENLVSQVEQESIGWSKRWPAPAKLNLMLRITGRREDGYHLLQTVFQIIDLCDWLVFHPVADGSVSLQNPIPGVPEQDDLTVRAANLLKKHAQSELGVRIEIEKNLPMGGGLGGGSSDAATTLIVLNKLWNINYSVEKLMELGLQLGADVPVFVYGHSAWAEGVGEQLEQINLPEHWFVIVKPDCHVNTKQIFLSEELTRDSKVIKISDFIAGQVGNDCSAVVRELYDPVRSALLDLSKYGESRLTGTGACVFAEYATKQEAVNVYEEIKNTGQVYLAKALNRSSVYEVLEQG
jgi:4-diphosphocytidyl-2-C-methyl-D-erythritol kinase